ncbi:type II toxin-antitoxin system HipA family toxin [Donghicola sp. XS_ASV15]|uniref:type II toxin-antitoxin system HipA family toxin n=1 Tax=Donghicola sp. XS_ASV15 TaxID=3241295 RepID=UPI0035187F6D
MTDIQHNFDQAMPCPRAFLRSDPRSLEVALDFGAGFAPRPVGTLDWDDTRRQAVLRWDARFEADPLPLSPVLVRKHEGSLKPRRGWAFEGAPALIGDSLPDGWARLLADYEIRASGGSPEGTSPLTRLSLVGLHGIGALTYRPAYPLTEPQEVSLEWFAGLAADVGDCVKMDDLTRLNNASGGTHGQKPKFLAQLSPDGETLRNHRAPLPQGWKHVLIKRRSRSDRNGAVEAEVAYGLMARAAGLRTTWMGMLGSNTREQYFVTQRFDRPGTKRLHVQTAAALFGVDFRTADLDYIDLLKLTRAITRNQAQVEEMMLRMIFNVRAVNRDDHLKNHAFLMDERGRWALAPAYDLCYSYGRGGLHALGIAGNRNQPGRMHFHDVARAIGIERESVWDMVSQVDAALVRWPEFAEACGVPRLLKSSIQDDIECARSWT